jgi:hypothetical protein
VVDIPPLPAPSHQGRGKKSRGNQEETQLWGLANHYFFLAKESLKRVKDQSFTSEQIESKLLSEGIVVDC